MRFDTVQELLDFMFKGAGQGFVRALCRDYAAEMNARCMLGGGVLTIAFMLPVALTGSWWLFTIPALIQLGLGCFFLWRGQRYTRNAENQVGLLQRVFFVHDTALRKIGRPMLKKQLAEARKAKQR